MLKLHIPRDKQERDQKMYDTKYISWFAVLVKITIFWLMTVPNLLWICREPHRCMWVIQNRKRGNLQSLRSCELFKVRVTWIMCAKGCCDQTEILSHAYHPSINICIIKLTFIEWHLYHFIKWNSQKRFFIAWYSTGLKTGLKTDIGYKRKKYFLIFSNDLPLS